MSKKIDLVGKKFGRLLVLEEVTRDSRLAKIRWECLCSCGKTTTSVTQSLVSGKILSCGCLKNELSKERCTTHGKSRTNIYRIWQGMIQRIRNPKSPAYKIYGGRGIKYCESWALFENFYKDMGKCPNDSYSLDRKNSNGDYNKDNCRWASQYTQQRNRSNNRWLEYDGKKLVLQDWSKILKTSPTNILNQLKRKEFSDVYNFYIKKNNKNGI